MPDHGVHFPAADGRRSSTALAQAVLGAAAAAVDPGLARRVQDETAWRTGYHRHLRELTRLTGADAGAGLAAARAGLRALHEQMVIAGDDGDRPLPSALRREGPLPATRTVQGAGPRPRTLTIPWRGEEVGGQDLLRLTGEWVRRGVVEPGVAEVVAALLDDPERLDLRGERLAILGAGAEMAPTGRLLAWGAEVVAVDLPAERVWSRLAAAAEAGSGVLQAPLTRGGTVPGLDLVAAAPAALAWLADRGPLGAVGNCTYAEGGTFVRLAAAADAVVVALREGPSPPGTVGLATPTDAYVLPDGVAAALRAGESVAPRWLRSAAPALRAVSAGRLMVPAPGRSDVGPAVADSLIPQQGPNYALAKRVQRWRALVTRADGGFAALHVAPPTRTASVLRNRVLAAAYSGAAMFGVEVFEPATSRALMAALLAHDLRAPRDRAAAQVPERDLTAAAAHGGLWRLPWEPRTALPLAVVRGAPAAFRRRPGR